MDFVVKKFDLLTVFELYNIYSLRSKIFVVEQNCAYQDPDEKDLLAYHVMLKDGNVLAGYARILAPGISYPEICIGRVIVGKEHRKTGCGKLLMNHCIKQSLQMFRNEEIVISAQAHLAQFYTDLGFKAEGEIYAEDDIPHIKMRFKEPGSSTPVI